MTVIAACGRCNATYDDDAWRALECCGALTAAEVRAYFTVTPHDLAIDLRRCRRCEAILARTQRVRASA